MVIGREEEEGLDMSLVLLNNKFNDMVLGGVFKRVEDLEGACGL